MKKKEYNKLNASYFHKHAAKKKNELGTDVYNKKRANYMKEYQAKQKQLKMILLILMLPLYNLLFAIELQKTQYCSRNKTNLMKLYQILTNNVMLMINNH